LVTRNPVGSANIFFAEKGRHLILGVAFWT
jgi:hypothetical protein